MKILSDYISQWKLIEGIKPKNDKLFIDEFCVLLSKTDNYDITYDGEGSYFGNQVSIKFESQYRKCDRNLCFEIAYSRNEIRVYDYHNEGYWTPEYLSLKKGEQYFDLIEYHLFKNLTRLFGLE